MPSLLGSNRFRACVAVVALGLLPATAPAGWILLRNDTGQALIVQEVVVVNQKVRCGLPQRLLAREAARCTPVNGTRKLLFFDPKKPQEAICSCEVPTAKEDLAYSIQTDGARVKLVPEKAASGPTTSGTGPKR